MTAIERQQYEDGIWAAQAPEVQQHRGKIVVVHQKRVVAVGSDYDALVQEAAAAEHCPWSELVVELVTGQDFETPLDDLQMTGE
jgi:hypothetical protein